MGGARSDKGGAGNIRSKAVVIPHYIVLQSLYGLSIVIIDGHECKPGFFDLIGIAAGGACGWGDFVPGGGEFGNRGAAADETVGPGAGAFEGDFCAAAGED